MGGRAGGGWAGTGRGRHSFRLHTTYQHSLSSWCLLPASPRLACTACPSCSHPHTHLTTPPLLFAASCLPHIRRRRKKKEEGRILEGEPSLCWAGRGRGTACLPLWEGLPATLSTLFISLQARSSALPLSHARASCHLPLYAMPALTSFLYLSHTCPLIRKKRRRKKKKKKKKEKRRKTAHAPREEEGHAMHASLFAPHKTPHLPGDTTHSLLHAASSPHCLCCPLPGGGWRKGGREQAPHLHLSASSCLPLSYSLPPCLPHLFFHYHRRLEGGRHVEAVRRRQAGHLVYLCTSAEGGLPHLSSLSSFMCLEEGRKKRRAEPLGRKEGCTSPHIEEGRKHPASASLPLFFLSLHALYAPTIYGRRQGWSGWKKEEGENGGELLWAGWFGSCPLFLLFYLTASSSASSWKEGREEGRAHLLGGRRKMRQERRKEGAWLEKQEGTHFAGVPAIFTPPACTSCLLFLCSLSLPPAGKQAFYFFSFSTICLPPVSSCNMPHIFEGGKWPAC